MSRRREIAEAARALVEQEGAAALTMRSLAHRLGMRAPSLYKHFPNKRALEAAVIASAFTEVAEALESGARTDDPLTGVARAYRAWALAHPHLYGLVNNGPLPRDLLPEGLEERAAAPVMAVTRTGDLARAAFAFAHGMVSLEIAGRFPPDADLDAAWAAGTEGFR